MKKQKILFYGNCQIGSISKIFQTHPILKRQFSVLDARDYKLSKQKSPAVANFLLGLPQSNGTNDPRKIEQIFSDADIVVFNAIDNNRIPEYCLTKNIIPNFDGLSICVPSFWYSGYFGYPYKFPLLDVFYYLNQLNLSNKEVLNTLLNESIPITKELFSYYHDFSLKGLDAREEDQSKLYNYISIKNWLLDTYKNKLLCYNHSHPTPSFFEFIINETSNKIDPSIEDVNLENYNFSHPRSDGHFLPTTFKFFNDLFPDMKPLTKLEISNYNWSTYNPHQPEIFIDKGMRFIKENEVLDGHPRSIHAPEVKSILGV